LQSAQSPTLLLSLPFFIAQTFLLISFLIFASLLSDPEVDVRAPRLHSPIANLLCFFQGTAALADFCTKALQTLSPEPLSLALNRAFRDEPCAAVFVVFVNLLATIPQLFPPPP